MNNHWGGAFEINGEDSRDQDEKNRNNMDWDRASISPQGYNHAHLDETQQSWLLGPSDKKNKKKYVDLGCIVCSHAALKWTLCSILITFIVIGLPIIITKSLPRHKQRPPAPDNYTAALHKALMFFDAQKFLGAFFAGDAIWLLASIFFVFGSLSAKKKWSKSIYR